MARINGKDSAYAAAGYQLPNGDIVYGSPGLTKRELFSAMAMQSIRTVNPACSSEEIAESAVRDADALLKELAK
jgi:hypothetical protein